MAKSKADEEEKLDGLEIISIGSLYSGPWEKKYWSSSRGKDRYPYPVGYQACRAYNGSTYKMEIQEGPKGPLFLINSADGHLCSGQTPDIAWEKFQKKGCPRMKIWHGKRFSCKVDGIEFFGFRNPFVQRLLRELVANVHGMAERSLLSSSFCNGASNMDHNKQSEDAHICSDLLPSLVGPQATKKRSKRREIISSSSIDDNKKPRVGDPTYSVELPNSTHGNHKQRSSLPPNVSFDEKHESCILLGAVRAGNQVKYVSGEKSTHSLAKDDLHFKSVDDPHPLNKKPAAAFENNKSTSSENSESITVVSNSFAEEKPLDRLQNTEVERLNFPTSSVFKSIDAPFPKDSQSAHDVDLCAPDTLDFVQDSSTNSASSILVTINSGIKEEFVANVVVSEDLVNKLHPEEETSASNSNLNSERSDFDSVGEDIAKSMMTVLLPQAIPLLKNSLSKKKKAISSSENFPSANKNLEENNGSAFLEAQSPGVDHSVVQRAEPTTKPIEIEKFDGSQCGDHLSDVPASPCNNVEADQCGLGKDTHCPKGGVKESWDSHAETSGGGDVLHDDKRQLNMTRRPQGYDLNLSESILGCMSTSKEVLIEMNQNVCKNLDENLLAADINFKDFKTVLDCHKAVGTSNTSVGALKSPVQSSRTDTIIKTGASEIGNKSSSKIPKKVYTRKKVSNTDFTTGNCNPPLLEGVTCTKVLDCCNLETEISVLDSEVFYMNSSVDEPHKMEFFNAKTGVGREFHDLHTDKTTVNSNTILDRRTPFSASEGQDTSSVPSVSHVEKPKAHFEEKLVGHENTVDVNIPGSPKQGKEFFDNKISSAKEVQGSSELKIQRYLELHNELEGSVEFLGCYFHPMPVLSLVLSRKGNEIYICVLCGLVVDENRTLFLYKVEIEGPRIGCPCFVGHTSVTWPSSTDVFGGKIAFERSGLQITPDGQCLVLLGSTRAPHCREGKLNCSCSACSLDSLENNAVKIVQVKAGYVSLLAKLETNDSFQCLLVFEPNHVIAAGENRRLHLWTMNSRWSAPTEKFVIQSKDYISPCILEMKRIPKCDSLVIGHNGFGEFTLWDISKRIFVSRFSAPCTSVHQFFPISLFSWQTETHSFNYSNVEAHINQIMKATKMCFSEHRENHSFPSLEREDIGIWFLVSTLRDFDSKQDYVSSDCQTSPVGWWRLALFVKNTLILGNALDPSAAAVGTSAGHGIMGTHDGLVYMWELLTGKKLGILHKFEGGSVSCIATDDSGSGVLAVVDDKGQLLVYQCLK